MIISVLASIARRMHVKAAIPPVCMILLAVVILVPARVSASVARDGPLGQDATLASLELAVDGKPVELSPAFDPGTTFYSATGTGELVQVEAVPTKDEARVASYTVDGDTTVIEEGEDKEAPSFFLKEGAITAFSLEVKAGDGSTTRNYHVRFARPSRQSLPEITLEASPSEYVAGLGSLFFTATRTGDTSAALDLTINITQEQEWLSDTSYGITIPAGVSEYSDFFLPATRFSSDVTESGTLTATVAAVNGYDTSSASAQVRVISQEGPAVVVTLEPSSYEVDEGEGTLEFVVLADAHSSVPRVGAFPVTVSSQSDQATFRSDDDPGDYVALSQLLLFGPSDFQQENGSLVGRKTASITILDDHIYEGDERFHISLGLAAGQSPEVILLDLQGDACVAVCPNPYPVTILDNEEALRLTVAGDRVSEDGTLTSSIEAGTVSGAMIAADHSVTFNFAGPAVYGEDYTISPADEDSADGHQVTFPSGTAAVQLTVTAVDDEEDEACEWIEVTATIGLNSLNVTGAGSILVQDDDEDSPSGVTPISVGLSGMLVGEITSDDVGPDQFSFEATGGESYVIEVKRPMIFSAIDENGVGGNPQLVPVSVVDPSIIEITDDQGNQLLGEHDQGGFSLNFARAFFTPEDDGTYFINVGAGPQDRSSKGCYTISVRADDHADDFEANSDVVLHPGETLTAVIDSDVAPDDPGLNFWDWNIFPPLRQGRESEDTARPRRGIESLDDRDVFRYEIAEPGMYEITVSNQPEGVGIWYIWDHLGNLWYGTLEGPEESIEEHHDTGTYYVEVGTPYESEGNTGTYTVSLTAVE